MDPPARHVYRLRTNRDWLDPAEARDWAASITESTRALNRFAKRLKETARDQPA